MTDLSVIIPIFNEACCLQSFHARLGRVVDQLGMRAELIYVNDGSTDNTQHVLDDIASKDQRVLVLELSRNFGHQAALSAGLASADGNVIVMLDGDGQHPPELIPEMIKLQSLGYDIVQCQRVEDKNSASLMKRITARLFYSLLSNMGEIDLAPGSADFRLITAEVLAQLRSLPEYHRFIRGMISWIGFRSILLPYRADHRINGASKYSIRKMLRLAADGMFSFSLMPLRLGFLIGTTFLLLALSECIYLAWTWMSGNQRELVPGWSSTIVLLTFSSGSIMVLLGFIGIYVGMIFQQVKHRPIFIVRDRSAKVGRGREAVANK